MHTLQKHPIVFGTLLLTGAGLICRFMGFFYRIYLSRVFGAEGMGIHSLIMPVAGLTFSLTGACFQTCISKFVAEQTKNDRHPFRLALSICFPLALLTSTLLYIFSGSIAKLWLAEPRCTPLLQALSLSILPSAINSCIKGYYYGKKRTVPPCVSQIFEQIIRIGSVFLLANKFTTRGTTPPLVIMVLGIVFGEIVSLAVILFFYLTDCLKSGCLKGKRYSPLTYPMFTAMLLPLLSNRIVLNFLQSMETVSIPSSLMRFGYTRSEALSLYGIFTGMVMPLLFFPTTITGSISVLLLPSVSEYHAHKEIDKIKNTLRKNIFFCTLLGLLSIFVFFTLGPFIGKYLYNNELAGTYIRTASFISPFLYLNSTLSGIIQGLGKTAQLFFINISGLIFRLLLIQLTIPFWGIQAYLYILLFTQVFQFLFTYHALRSYL